jgi:hypothetical protein
LGKGPRPQIEELEFIFELFLKGYSDPDVLARYTKLEEEGQLRFPYRTDYRLIKHLREEFTAARSVLEPYLRQQIDPIMAKAREEHLGEVAQLLRNWRDEIKSYQSLGSYALVYNAEEEPLFGNVLAHCPSVKVEYEAFSAQREQYELAEEGPVKAIGIETADLGKNENYDKLVVQYAVCVALGQSLPEYEIEGESLRIHAGQEDKIIATGSREALDRCLDLHKKLIGKYRDSPDVNRLLAIRERLLDSQQSLLKKIELVLNERSHIRQKCKACPELTS